MNIHIYLSLQKFTCDFFWRAILVEVHPWWTIYFFSFKNRCKFRCVWVPQTRRKGFYAIGERASVRHPMTPYLRISKECSKPSFPYGKRWPIVRCLANPEVNMNLYLATKFQLLVRRISYLEPFLRAICPSISRANLCVRWCKHGAES